MVVLFRIVELAFKCFTFGARFGSIILRFALFVDLLCFEKKLRLEEGCDLNHRRDKTLVAWTRLPLDDCLVEDRGLNPAVAQREWNDTEGSSIRFQCLSRLSFWVHTRLFLAEFELQIECHAMPNPSSTTNIKTNSHCMGFNPSQESHSGSNGRLDAEFTARA